MPLKKFWNRYERVTLYLIGQCLCAPENSIIIIDEPEIHLHKSLDRPVNINAIEAILVTNNDKVTTSKSDKTPIILFKFLLFKVKHLHLIIQTS